MLESLNFCHLISYSTRVSSEFLVCFGKIVFQKLKSSNNKDSHHLKKQNKTKN